MARSERAISITPSPNAYDFIEAHNHTDHSRSSAVSRIVERYAWLMEQALPKLSRAEWSLILDALNGCILWDNPRSVAYFVMEVSDRISLNGADKEFGCNGKALITTLKRLDNLGRSAVVDFAERWWAAVARGEEHEIPGE